MTVLDEPVEPGEVSPRRPAPRHYDDEDSVGLEPSQGEDERLQRGAIGPLGIVDEDQDGPGRLHRSEQFEQRGTDPDRVSHLTVSIAEFRQRRVPRIRGRPDKLFDDSEGEQLLGLLAAGLPELKPLCLTDETVRQGSLPDAGLAGEEDDTGMTATHIRGLGEQAPELTPSADEGSIHLSALVEHWRQMLQPTLPRFLACR
jgi:hypothetical protein